MSGYREAQPPGFEKAGDLRTWESELKCPRCAFELFSAKKDEIEVSACGRCGGVWLSNDDAKRAIATGSRVPEELARKVERVTRAHKWVMSKPRHCPSCQKVMHRTKYGEVVIDLCEHGTWFDRTEIAAVMRHMRGEPAIPPGAMAAFTREKMARDKWGALAGLVQFFDELLGKPDRP